MPGALEPGTVSTKQQRIAELAKQAPPMGFTSLNHHLDLPWLVEAYQSTHDEDVLSLILLLFQLLQVGVKNVTFRILVKG